ncbi:MAG: hypothetical protein AAFN77_07220 [Planctomycetota bacterium]
MFMRVKWNRTPRPVQNTRWNRLKIGVVSFVALAVSSVGLLTAQDLLPPNDPGTVARPISIGQPFLPLIDDVVAEAKHCQSGCQACGCSCQQKTDGSSAEVESAFKAADRLVAQISPMTPKLSADPPRYTASQLADVLWVSLQGSSSSDSQRRAIETALAIADEQGKLSFHKPEDLLNLRLKCLEQENQKLQQELARMTVQRDGLLDANTRIVKAIRQSRERVESRMNLASLKSAVEQLERQKVRQKLLVDVPVPEKTQKSNPPTIKLPKLATTSVSTVVSVPDADTQILHMPTRKAVAKPKPVELPKPPQVAKAKTVTSLNRSLPPKRAKSALTPIPDLTPKPALNPEPALPPKPALRSLAPVSRPAPMPAPNDELLQLQRDVQKLNARLEALIKKRDALSQPLVKPESIPLSPLYVPSSPELKPIEK